VEERRDPLDDVPNPPITTGNEGLPYAVSFWADRIFFQPTVAVIFGTVADMVPKDFIEDRRKMSPDRPFEPEQLKAAVPMMKEQWRAHVGMIAAQLADGRNFLLGDKPTLTDIHVYMNVWFMRNALAPVADELMKEFTRVTAWADRMKAIGHGKPATMSSKEALAIAKEAEPEPARASDKNEPSGLKLGDRVSVMPDDYGRDPVTGEIVLLSTHEIAVRRKDPAVGNIVVHFPRAGFWVRPG
jgi:hypothetical protein